MTKIFDDSEPSRQLVKQCSQLKPGNALDVGCGKGKNAIWLAEHGWKVDAFDPKCEALKIAKDRAEKQNINTINFVEADIVSYKTEYEYDLIVCAMILHFFKRPELEIAIKRIKRWTKPNGKLFISVMNDKNSTNLRPTLFKKSELETYFSEWKVEKSYEVETKPLLMTPKSAPQVFYFSYFIVHKRNV